jgi:hypothetical protein
MPVKRLESEPIKSEKAAESSAKGSNEKYKITCDLEAIEEAQCLDLLEQILTYKKEHFEIFAGQISSEYLNLNCI